MDWFYQRIVRPLFFLLDAERAHRLAAVLLALAHRHRVLRALLPACPSYPALRVNALGREFASPLGLAAGFDKAATMYNALGALGFAAVEVGTVTAQPQAGNARPRLFRLPADGALVNRMGFNNPGAAAVAASIAAHPPEPGLVLGVNLGKSRVASLEQAAGDYVASASELGALAHYVVVNVSSPNTPGLRTLQHVDALAPVLRAVQDALARAAARPPLLVKIAPDLDDAEIDAVTDLALELGLAGIIATNTTIERRGLATSREQIDRVGEGGLSGAPLRARTLQVIRRIHARAGRRLTIVGAGGIGSGEDAWAAICAGATLVQIYTAFVYQGPTLARRIAHELAARLAASGYDRIAQAVGSERATIQPEGSSALPGA